MNTATWRWRAADMPLPKNHKVHAAIIELMDDGVVRSFDVMRGVAPRMSESALRSILNVLVTSRELDVVRTHEDARTFCYVRNPARRPFLLGLVCRQRLDAGVPA